jgi:deoxyribonuclease-4
MPSAAAIDAFLEARKETGITHVVSHASYLINIAAQEETAAKQARALLAAELQACQLLEIPTLVLHPGGRAENKEAGLHQIGRIAAELCQEYPGVQLALELMAGQGSSLGSSLEELASMLEAAQQHPNIGICLDTCHAYAAGYDIGNREQVTAFLDKLFSLFSPEKLFVIHLNDSKKGCGSKVDRHASIGKGNIALQGFKQLINDERLTKVPLILETPYDTLEELGVDLDQVRALLS